MEVRESLKGGRNRSYFFEYREYGLFLESVGCQIMTIVVTAPLF